MSTTPLTEAEGQDETDSRERSETVWRQLRDTVHHLGKRVLDRLSSAVRGHQSSDDDATTPLLANTEQPRTQTPVRPASEAQRERPATPAETSGVQITHSDETLRVYDPDESEAYVDSDTWRPVER